MTQTLLTYTDAAMIVEWTMEPEGDLPHFVRMYGADGSLRSIAQFATLLEAEDYITDVLGI